MLTFLLLSLLVRSAHSACPVSSSQLGADLDAAYAAYAAFDLPTFTTRATVARDDLACVSEVLSPARSARVHLIEGLRAWVAKDPTAMTSSFRGLIASDPSFELPLDIAPNGSRVRTVFTDAQAAGSGATKDLTSGTGVSLRVDGAAPGHKIPVERAAVVQVSGTAALQTWYLLGGDAPADLVAAVQGPPVQAPAVASGTRILDPAPVAAKHKSGHTSLALLLSGVGVGVASGVALGVAGGLQDGLPKQPTEDAANKAYGANHLFGYGGFGLGAVALGLGATAVIVGKW